MGLLSFYREEEGEMLIVICPHCKAPTFVPPNIEKEIEEMRGYTCWECNHKVRISIDFKNYVRATRPFKGD